MSACQRCNWHDAPLVVGGVFTCARCYRRMMRSASPLGAQVGVDSKVGVDAVIVLAGGHVEVLEPKPNPQPGRRPGERLVRDGRHEKADADFLASCGIAAPAPKGGAS